MTIPETMNAWVMRIGEREPIKKTIPVPKPEENEVLVKIEASGVCHSDCTLLAMDEAPPTWNFQKEFVLGHEGAGTIVQLGSAVDSSKFQVGDRVGILIVPGCDKISCIVCSQGLSRLCREKGSGKSVGDSPKGVPALIRLPMQATTDWVGMDASPNMSLCKAVLLSNCQMKSLSRTAQCLLMLFLPHILRLNTRRQFSPIKPSLFTVLVGSA